MERTEARWSSARAALSLGFGALAVLVGGIVGWSIFASISGAVIVTGWVAIESHNQVVEHIDGGTVSEILVRDGAAVAAGDVLLRFDDALPRSEEAILQAQHAELVARRNRLEAEFRNASTVVWDQELATLGEADADVRKILTGQERLFRARNDARTGEVAQLRERIGQARQEIAGLEARGVSLEQQSELLGQELAARRRLVEQGAMKRSALLTLERTAESLQGLGGGNQRRRHRPHTEPDRGVRNPDSADRHQADRGGGRAGARGPFPRERGAGASGRRARASGTPGGARAGVRGGVRHDGVRTA